MAKIEAVVSVVILTDMYFRIPKVVQQRNNGVVGSII